MHTYLYGPYNGKVIGLVAFRRLSQPRTYSPLVSSIQQTTVFLKFLPEERFTLFYLLVGRQNSFKVNFHRPVLCSLVAPIFQIKIASLQLLLITTLFAEECTALKYSDVKRFILAGSLDESSGF